MRLPTNKPGVAQQTPRNKVVITGFGVYTYSRRLQNETCHGLMKSPPQSPRLFLLCLLRVEAIVFCLLLFITTKALRQSSLLLLHWRRFFPSAVCVCVFVVEPIRTIPLSGSANRCLHLRVSYSGSDCLIEGGYYETTLQCLQIDQDE